MGNDIERPTRRVLWFSNVPLGEGPSVLNTASTVFGGWLDGMLGQLVGAAGFQFDVAYPANGPFRSGSGEHATYHTFGSARFGGRQSGRVAERIEAIIGEVRPDLVHVFGTEALHSETVVQLCREKGIPCLVQIQGVMNSIARHHDAWLPRILGRIATPAELVARKSARSRAKVYRRAAARERRTLGQARFVLGRTSYDRSWVRQMNPKAIYYHSDENLRPVFYDAQWKLGTQNRNKLLFSQPAISYKGAHVAIKALPEVLREVPDTELVMIGKDPIGGPGLVSLVRRTTYGWYLWALLRKYGVKDKVRFVGTLGEEQVRDAYLASHIFLSCSSVENSSNAVSEAQLLGMPVVASDVGGTRSLVADGQDGVLYAGGSAPDLAKSVLGLLSDDDRAADLGYAAHGRSMERHDRARNSGHLLRIYEDVLCSIPDMPITGRAGHS